MRRRSRMQYVIKNAQGQELVCPSLADLLSLYAQGFVSDDDMVRSETSTRWVRAGDMPALRGSRAIRANPQRFLLILIALTALAIGAGLLVRMR